MSISGDMVLPVPTPTLSALSLEVFTETDDTNPLHVNYDFTKSNPLTIIPDEEIIEKKTPRGPIRHYKIKKT